MIERGNLWKTTIERGSSLNSEIPEWLHEFRENLVDDEIPVHGGSHASSSHEASSEPMFKRREDLGKHSVYTYFPFTLTIPWNSAKLVKISPGIIVRLHHTDR